MSESKLNGLRILSASVDANLNQTRALILQDHGFDVTTSESLEDATRWIERQQFDVLIFGSTLPRDTCWKLAEVFRNRNANGKIIEILPSPWAAPKNRPDVTVSSGDSPTKLVDAILERIM